MKIKTQDTQRTRSWLSLIAQLARMANAGAGDDANRSLTQVPDLALIGSAITLAGQFLDQQIVPPDQISATEPGMIHFHWYKTSYCVVVTINSAGSAEVVTYTKEGTLTMEVLTW